jgi:hypothetical protein
MVPLLPVMGIVNASLESDVSQRLIAKVKAESYTDVVKLGTNWLFKNRETNNSPNNINSPLYPDGIMSPLWIQKVKSNPGVVLGIYDLMFVKGKNDPLGAADAYREKDSNLCLIINEKRKSMAGIERGRKFIPVFILFGVSTESSSCVEERLAFIRKTCGSEKIFTVDSQTIANDDDEIKKFMKGYCLNTNK